MNRLWKQFFGNGLSAATDDLGAQGETPSHPELLDWLACEFRDSGWDIQHMMKLIVNSQTYLQDSKARPELKEIGAESKDAAGDVGTVIKDTAKGAAVIKAHNITVQ